MPSETRSLAAEHRRDGTGAKDFGCLHYLAKGSHLENRTEWRVSYVVADVVFTDLMTKGHQITVPPGMRRRSALCWVSGRRELG
jgi:hypothetical protein